MADVVLEEYDGAKTTYSDLETVTLLDNEGNEETFVHEDLVAEPVEATVELDFSGGDMVVAPEEGQVFSGVNIPTPANLIPDNIAEGMSIAGIIGTLAAGGGAKIASGVWYGGSSPKTITHNLGVIPDLVIFWQGVLNAAGKMVCGVGFSSKLASLLGLSSECAWCVTQSAQSSWLTVSKSSYPITTTVSSYTIISKATATSFTVGSSQYPVSTSNMATYCYKWIAIGGLT